MDTSILDEQIAYYRARAQEYDESILGAKPFARGQGGAEELEGELASAVPLLQSMGAFEQVLELACGTGIWTQVLLQIGQQITVIDAAPEMLAIARHKLGDAPVRYHQADVFHWEPVQEYDLVFFAAWLSHVPPEALDAFLTRVYRAVRPGGQLVIIDQYTPTDEDRLLAKEAIYARRPLRDGRLFTIVKVFYDLTLLQDKLTSLGFEVIIHKLGDIFFFLSATRQ